LKAYRAWRWLWQYAGPIFGAIGVARLLDISFGDVWQAILAAAPFISGQKIFWAILAVLGVFFSAVEWMHRGSPLTVMSTHIELFMDSGDGLLAHLVRTQEIRANRDDVTAYQAKFWADPNIVESSIPAEHISMHADHCLPGEQSFELIEGSKRGWKAMHRFKAIPMHFYKLGLNTISRVERYRLVNCFGTGSEWYDAHMTLYHHKKIRISVYFHPDNPCSAANCKGYWIARHGMVEMNLQVVSKDGREGVSLLVARPVSGDTYRVMWKHPNGQQLALPETTTAA
jgi:hypothetical protein